MYYLSNICSLCLVPNSNLKSILSQDIDGTVIEQKLIVFSLEIIQLKPYIPIYICNNCLANLNNIHKFRLRCLNSLTTLNKYVQTLKEHGSYKNLSVTLTDIKYENDLSLGYDIQNNSETWENQIQEKCLQYNVEIANEFIKEENLFHEHTNFITDNNSTEVTQLKTEESEESSLEESNVSPEPEVKSCDSDPFQGNGSDDDDIPSTALCSTTYGTDNTSNDLEVSKTQNSVSSTMIEAEGTNSYETKYATGTATFTNSQNITQQSTGNTNYKTNKDLKKKKNTLKSINLQNPQKCPSCPKTFKYSSELTKHLRIHTGDKPYVCEVCNKAFSQGSTLVIHRRDHDNIRPFSCPTCEKAFKRKANLDRHMVIHTGEKPYVCDVCKAAYNDKSHLIRHIRKVHNSFQFTQELGSNCLDYEPTELEELCAE